MKFKNVSAEGFLSLGAVSVNLDRKSLTLVEGLNHDSTAESNGAGKSSIFEALYWCLYGVTRRGLTGDEVINRHTKTGTLVEVDFESRGRAYRVTRARKHKVVKTGFWLADSEMDLTKGVMKDTQALLEEIMGISQLAFQKTVFFGQGDIKPIAELTDSELKAVFEQGLGLSQIPIDAQKVAGYRKGLESSMAAKLGDLASSRAMLELTEASLEEKKRAVEGFEAAKLERLASMKLTLEAMRGVIKEAADKSAELALALVSVGELIARDEGSVAEVRAIRAKFSEKRSKILSELARVTAVSGMASSRVAELNRGEEEVRGKVGSDCAACGLVMDENAVETSIARISSTRETILSEQAKLSAARTAKNEEIVRMDALLRPFDVKAAEIEARLKDLEAQRAAAASSKAVADNTVMYRGADLELAIKEIEVVRSSDGGGYTEAVRAIRERFSAHKLKGEDLEDEVNGLILKLETAKLLEAALSNAGMKGLVFDRVTPELNKYTNDSMEILDAGTTVEISTTSTLKSGEKREKFSVSVETASGAAVFGGHSGGEKQKVNLAVSLAFNTLMRRSSVNAPNLLVLDEPFEALDQGSSDQVLELLTSIDVDNVFLITHNQSVKDLVPNKILVEKCDGVSTIS